MPKEKPKFTIVKDTREKSGYNFRASANCNGMVVKKLDTGDYSIEGLETLIMIERKSLADLWGSLSVGRERFLREMERAKAYPARYLVIEGTINDIQGGNRFSKITPDFIFGNLISLEVKYGIHVIFTSKRVDIAQTYIRKLLAKLHKYCLDGVIK